MIHWTARPAMQRHARRERRWRIAFWCALYLGFWVGATASIIVWANGP